MAINIPRRTKMFLATVCLLTAFHVLLYRDQYKVWSIKRIIPKHVAWNSMFSVNVQHGYAETEYVLTTTSSSKRYTPRHVTTETMEVHEVVTEPPEIVPMEDVREMASVELIPLTDNPMEHEKNNDDKVEISENGVNAQRQLQGEEESLDFNALLGKVTALMTEVMTPAGKEEAIKETKATAAKEIESLGKSFLKNGNWSDYLMPHGGKPMQSIVFTTWRSGSTFLGEALSVHPAMFYFYEPLLHFKIVQVRDGDLAKNGLKTIRNLMHCNYSDNPGYVNYYAKKGHMEQHLHNMRVWKYCYRNRKLCNDPDFLSKICQEFPFQSMKTVRMRLNLSEPLITDPTLNAKIVLLVRDPRGILVSRKQRVWCPGNPDCDKPKLLCQDMVDDFHSAVELRKKFPDKYLIVRYEDLSKNPEEGIKAILNFYKLQYHKDVENYLKKHTSRNAGGVSSTFRDSKTTPFRWKEYFMEHLEELNEIQSACEEAMNLWGYNVFKVESDSWDEFDPINAPPFPDLQNYKVQLGESQNILTSPS